jgi:hypothetical protein
VIFFPVRLRKQAFAATGKAKPAAIAAGFLFVDLAGQISNHFVADLKRLANLAI